MNSGTLRALANATSGQRESLGPTILTRVVDALGGEGDEERERDGQRE